MKRALILLWVLCLIYIGSYMYVRSTYVEIWERDQNSYVLFPNTFLYYFYRPASLIDAKVSGIRVHIGPHQ